MLKKNMACLGLALSLGLAGCQNKSVESLLPDTGEAAAAVQAVMQEDVAGEITISCFESMTYKTLLEEAVKLFEARYPGTKIHIETVSQMPEVKTMETEDGMYISTIEYIEDTQEKEAYINRVATALMGGQGADIYAMDVLPAYKYAEGGFLENLQYYMDADPDFSEDDYLKNIFSAVRYKGGQYILPVNYNFTYVSYDSTLISNLEKRGYSLQELIAQAEDVFEQVAAEHGEPVALFGDPAGSLFTQLLKEDYQSFIDIENKTVRLNDGRFADLLNQVMDYEEKGYLKKFDLEGDISMEAIELNQMERYFYKIKSAASLFSHYMNQMEEFGLSFGFGYGNEEDDLIAGLKTNVDGTGRVLTNQAYGLNANSANKRLAWEFIKFLSGEEMQSSANLSYGSLPVHNAARDLYCEMMFENILSMSEEGAEKELTERQKELMAEYKNTVETMSAQLSQFTVQDDIVNDILDTELEFFFEGSKTAEEVADLLQNRIELYLNE